MGIIPLYPDNPDRSVRAQQLSNDCDIFFTDLTDSSIELEKAVHDYSEKVRGMLLSLGVDPNDPKVSHKEYAIDKGVGITVCQEIGEIIFSLYSMNSISSALLIRMAKNVESIPLKSGGEIVGENIIRRTGSAIEYEGAEGVERIAISNIKFPTWLRFKAGVGGFAGALVLTIAIETIIDAIEGSELKAKLQQYIRDLYCPRMRLKSAVLINREVTEEIQKTIGNLNTIEEVLKESGLSVTQEIVDRVVQKHADAVKAKLDTEGYITTNTQKAQDQLKLIDQQSGAYTNDDPTNSSCEPVKK